ncbi:MAG: hypothetical protein ACOCXD_01240 [Bacteroidota bacterium]
MEVPSDPIINKKFSEEMIPWKNRHFALTRRQTERLAIAGKA